MTGNRLLLVAMGLFGFTATAFSQTITFNDQAPVPPGFASHVNYVESGYTFSATGGTSQFSIDPAYYPTNLSADGTDFQSFEQGSGTWTLTPSSGVFDLVSMDAAALYLSSASTLTVTGNLQAGGTVQDVINIPSGAGSSDWANYVLPPTFVGLTSVDFDNSSTFVGIDNVVLVAALTYTVGGTISGLTGAGLELQNNGGDTLPVAALATDFTFATALPEDADYAVTVSTQPAGQSCSITSGSGTITGADVTDVSVTCADDSVMPPEPTAPAAPIPTMSIYGLMLTTLGLLLVATRRLRMSARRK